MYIFYRFKQKDFLFTILKKWKLLIMSKAFNKWKEEILIKKSFFFNKYCFFKNKITKIKKKKILLFKIMKKM